MSPTKIPFHILTIGSLFVALACNGLFELMTADMLSETGSRPAQTAPEFELTTFEGETIKLSDFRGTVVVINFWAGWAGPCRDAAPVLQAAWEEYQDQEVVFIGVAFADHGPSSRAFLDEFGITYLNGPDLETRISEDYNVQGVPETFFIDRDGNIAETIIGLIDAEEFRTILDGLLQTS